MNELYFFHWSIEHICSTLLKLDQTLRNLSNLLTPLSLEQDCSSITNCNIWGEDLKATCFWDSFENLSQGGLIAEDQYWLIQCLVMRWYTTMRYYHFLISNLYYHSALRDGGVMSSWPGRVAGRAGGRGAGRPGCQTCRTCISVTAWWIFPIRSSVEFCPIWACPWAKNLSNLAQIWSRLCRMHISETAGWIDPI